MDVLLDFIFFYTDFNIFLVVFERSSNCLGNHFLFGLPLIVLRRRWGCWSRRRSWGSSSSGHTTHSRHSPHSHSRHATLLHRLLHLCPDGGILQPLCHLLQHGRVVCHSFHVLAHHRGNVGIVPHHLLNHWVLFVHENRSREKKEHNEYVVERNSYLVSYNNCIGCAKKISFLFLHFPQFVSLPVMPVPVLQDCSSSVTSYFACWDHSCWEVESHPFPAFRPFQP